MAKTEKTPEEIAAQQEQELATLRHTVSGIDPKPPEPEKPVPPPVPNAMGL